MTAGDVSAKKVREWLREAWVMRRPMCDLGEQHSSRWESPAMCLWSQQEGLAPFTLSLQLIMTTNSRQKTKSNSPRTLSKQQEAGGEGNQTWRMTDTEVSFMVLSSHIPSLGLRAALILELCSRRGQKKFQKNTCFSDQRTRQEGPAVQKVWESLLFLSLFTSQSWSEASPLKKLHFCDGASNSSDQVVPKSELLLSNQRKWEKGGSLWFKECWRNPHYFFLSPCCPRGGPSHGKCTTAQVC